VVSLIYFCFPFPSSPPARWPARSGCVWVARPPEVPTRAVRVRLNSRSLPWILSLPWLCRMVVGRLRTRYVVIGSLDRLPCIRCVGGSPGSERRQAVLAQKRYVSRLYDVTTRLGPFSRRARRARAWRWSSKPPLLRRAQPLLRPESVTIGWGRERSVPRDQHKSLHWGRSWAAPRRAGDFFPSVLHYKPLATRPPWVRTQMLKPSRRIPCKPYRGRWQKDFTMLP